MKYFDAFSGYGGFSLGIQQAYELSALGTKSENSTDSESQPPQHGKRPLCIGYSEIDKYAIQTYQKHFNYEQCEYCKNREYLRKQSRDRESLRPIGDKPDNQVPRTESESIRYESKNNCQCKHKPYGSITDIDARTLPDFDLFVGGFPCQAFSIAGKRGGFEDTRGTLIYDVLRIVKEKHPKLVLLENVKGLLSHDGGRTFKTIITSLAELGYAVEWQVLNAKNFGVPQNRERVFIIGHLGGFGGRQVFPLGSSDTVDTQSDGQGNAYCLQAGGDKHRGTYIKQLNNPTHSNNRLYGEDGISPALNTAQGGNRQPKIVKPVLTPDRIEKRQNGRRMKEDGEPSFTLTGQDKHGIYDGMKIRRLTPTECERLMGLPDGWTEGVSDTQRYKLCGNGVVVNVVEEIIKRLFKDL